MTTPVEVSAELRPSLAGFGTPPVFTLEGMPAARAASGDFFPSAEQVIGDRPIDIEDRTIPGPAGEPDITVTILRPRGLTGVVPGLYNI
ncbi:MAG: alpha/beta hydrolase, partial [Actinobacteria bacterium]|nr:alpha/beta hydrolase [Actinomycetota bacterium]